MSETKPRPSVPPVESSPNPSACVGCGRDGAQCWVIPCLYLEDVLARGAGALEVWVRARGGKLFMRGAS